MMRIRKAEQEDVPWLLEQLRAFSAFYGTRRPLFPADPAIARAKLEALLATQPVFVAARPMLDSAAAEDERLGFIAGYLVPSPDNPDITVLLEKFWWVPEAYRGTSAGARLLQHFVAFGRECADWIVMTLEAKSPVDDRVLVKLGFQPFERSLLLEV